MTNPIISRDHFVACIEVLKEADDMARRINTIVREYGKGDFISGYAFSNSDCETKLIETLEIALNDINHWISWWCLEADYGREQEFAANVIYGDQTYDFTSAEKLYDFLVAQ